MRTVTVNTYKKATPDDIKSIQHRQTYKVWDHGDTITYGLPGGKLVTYQFVDRSVRGEVLEAVPLGWCAPSAPAVVYEAEVGLTKNPNVIIVGDYVRTAMTKAISVWRIDDSIYNPVEPAPAPVAAAPAPAKQQHPKNPRHTNQFKKRPAAVATTTQSITSQSIPLVTQPIRVQKPRIPLMSIPLSG
jgi:hypothetical protein